MQRSRSIWVLFGLVASLVVATAPSAIASATTQRTSPSPPRVPSVSRTGQPQMPVCYPGEGCYSYVYGYNFADSAGATVSLFQADPSLANRGRNEGHSLQEMSVESSDGKQIVEIGWTVDHSLNHDLLPHLFIYHWINGNPTCYNTCGFVSTSSTLKAGMAVTVGVAGRYGIVQSHNAWVLTYNGQELGYYPNSDWHGTYKRAGLIQAFGEVAEAALPACTQMGNGLRGRSLHSSFIRDFTLVGATTAPDLTVARTDGRSYSYGYAEPTSYRLGGPGIC